VKPAAPDAPSTGDAPPAARKAPDAGAAPTARWWRAPGGSALAALATGCLYAACFPGRGGTHQGAPLAFVAFAPLVLALERSRSLARATLLGWAAGATACALGFSWLLGPLRAEGGLPLPAACLAYVLFAAAQAARFAALAAGAFVLRRRLGLAPSTSFAVAFVVSERCTPALIPWNLAAALVDAPGALALARLFGPAGAALGAIAINAALVELGAVERGAAIVERAAAAGRATLVDRATSAGRAAIASRTWAAGRATRPAARARIASSRPAPSPHVPPPRAPRRLAARSLAWAALALALMAAPAWSRRPEGNDAPPLRVGVVQASSAAGPRAVDASAAWARLIELQREARARGAALVAFGEGALPFAPEASSLAAGEALAYGRAFGVPTLVGAVVLDEEDGATGRQVPANSLLAFTPDGLAGRYDKATLLPFSEYLPFERWAPWLRGLSPASGRFRAGSARGALRVAGLSIAPSICFEDLFSPPMRRGAREHGVGLLVNVTNDGWFGDTAEPWLHLAHARLRAAELGRPLVRASATGPSALIDADGRLVAAAEPFTDAVVVGDVRPARGPLSPYGRCGDLGWIAALVALAIVARPRRRDGRVDITKYLPSAAPATIAAPGPTGGRAPAL
jgi:apolipoprotein N-acyltransferase